jgi:hypothetical protein
MSAKAAIMSESEPTIRAEPDLKGLLERVEGASGPDAVLDRLIVEALQASGLCRECWGLGGYNRGDGHRCERCNRTYADPVTDSLDAALALVDRVLPEMGVALGTCFLGSSGPRQPWATLSIPSNERVATATGYRFKHPTYLGDAATPALSVLAALLRAKASQS